MGEIIIKHRAGGETKLQSKQATVKITRAEQRKQLLGEDVLTITTKSAEPIAFEIGDYIDIFGSIYTINQLPTIERTGTRLFEQTIVLEGTQYELLDVQFILPGNTMYDNLTGDLNDFIDVLIQNANRIYPGKWKKGAVPENTEVKTLSFSEKNCLATLQTLCEEYSTEFEIAVSTTGTRTLHIKQVGLQFPFPFTYGRTGGLYQLTRQNVNSQSVVTRLYVYGGRNNLGNTYRNSKLCLPGKEKNDSYIEDANAVQLYGVKENTKTFSDIFPARVGSITALGSEYFAFVDNTMFDLNEKEADGETTKWLIPGVGAKIRMQTGNLAGYEFDVHAYDHGTFELQVVPFIDESGFKFPSETNEAFQFAPGDKYIFTDINLPDVYITDAEAKLETEGEKHYNKYSQPQVQYSLAIHPRFLEKYAGAPEVIPNIFALGDQIQVIDDDIGVNKSLRITGFTRDALDPYRYTLTLSEAAYSKTIINRIISDIKDITDIIELNNLADPSKARRNWRASQEVLANVFDPDGKYYSEKIRPLSIETSMLAVGARSQQFTLQNVRFEPNYEGNPNKIMITGGHLIHYTVEDTIRYWEMVQATYSNLVSNTAYYIYARCSKTTATGSIILATTQRKVDYEEGYYTFLIGVLNSVPDDDDDGLRPARLISLTYGASTINGRFIKTGRIESSGGGSTYFDLDNGEIGGNIKFISSDGTNKDIADLDDVAQETKDYINNTLPGILDEIQGQLDGQIEQFFETYDPTTSNAPANSWTTTQEKEDHLGDLFYNTSTGKVFRWVKESGVYKWQELQDSEVAQALALANDALALAREKRRIFTSTPYTPYEVGDLWVQGANGDIMRCKTPRASGNYSSSDWEKASKYTSDASLTTFINGTFATTVNKISELEIGLDGKVESWFQTTDPANAWTTDALKAKHAGDMWYSPTTKLLKRYTGSGSTYRWTTIEDQKAIAAYTAASQAQDTADGKRRVFVDQPYPPYDIGDLWVNASFESTYNNDLLRCKTAKAIGTAFSINHWEKASDYTNDDTALEAISQIAGIEIGGRNLIKKTDYFTLYNHLSVEASLTEQETTYKGEKIWQLSMTPTAENLLHFQTEESAHGVRTGVQKTFYANRPYILSIYWKPISHADISVGLLASNIGGWQALGTQEVGGGWYRTIASRTGATDAVDFLSIAFKCPSATAGTPIVIQWACPQLEVGTKVTDYKAAPEDDRALIAAYNYLKEALGLSTDVSGGLVATSVVLLRNALNQVVGGMSGMSGNEGFWMGGTYEDYVAEIADVFIKSGKSRFKGEIIADSGLIGGILHILGNALTSKYFKISDEDILSKANAVGVLTATINAIQAGTMLSLTQESPTAVFESNEVEIECRTLLPTVYWGHKYTEMHYAQRPRIYMANENSSCTLVLKIEVLNNGVVVAQNQRSWPYDYNGGSENPYSELSANYWYLEKGTVKIRVTAQITSILNFDENSSFKFWHLLSGSFYGSITNIAIQHYHKRTEIGGNGFYSFWDTAKYLYYSAQEGLHLKGNIDIPGVLAAGMVTAAGSHSKKWGAKVATDLQTISKGGTGIYIVPHNVNHSDYIVSITCHGSGRYFGRCTTRSNTSITVAICDAAGNASDLSDFDYTLIGSN